MTWYGVSLLLEGIHDVDPPIEALWEEVIIVLQADNEVEARVKADGIGRAREHSYDVAGPTPHAVRWIFRHVERVCEIEGVGPIEGTEVLSRFLRATEVASLLTPFDDVS